LVWFDRLGRTLGTVLKRERYGWLRLSPDAQRLAAEVGSPADIWVYELSRGTGSRFTFNTQLDTSPVWSPDGRYIVFSSDRGSHIGDLYIKPSSGTSDEQLLLTSSDSIKVPQDWSRDGKYLLYQAQNTGNRPVLWFYRCWGIGSRSPCWKCLLPRTMLRSRQTANGLLTIPTSQDDRKSTWLPSYRRKRETERLQQAPGSGRSPSLEGSFRFGAEMVGKLFFFSHPGVSCLPRWGRVALNSQCDLFMDCLKRRGDRAGTT
jgi:dipeptidyl aminopeptidase/acylaminoacyl peptidase